MSETELIRVKIKLLEELKNTYGRQIQQNHSFEATKAQLVECAINISLGKEVEIIKIDKRKCLKIKSF